jgi:hypothetical protein
MSMVASKVVALHAVSLWLRQAQQSFKLTPIEDPKNEWK